MNKFIFKSLFTFSIILGGYLVVSYIVNGDDKKSNDYLAAIEDKHKRIGKINSPKIILAGGSNLAFGINSEKIQKDLSIPVVNLGLHAGLGLEFIINELKTSIKKDDIIILSIEYFLEKKGSYRLKTYTKTLYPNASKYFKKNMKEDISIHIEKTRKNLKSINQSRKVDTSFSIYSRKGFNKFGDVVSHLDLIPPKEIANRTILSYRIWEGIEILNDFFDYANSIGVHVFFIYPNYPKSEYKKNKKIIDKLHQDLMSNLLIETLGTPKDFIFNDSLFFDTIYHLNKEGRNLRTIRLIELLKNSASIQQCMKKITKTK
ncbi:hypothetical protein GZ212_10280 [Mangrovimonas sp. CR14]|uniref:hypothetical protein n=1 Tax=Mangrovimonas sp. CR14 TaxID=2706120 RepID=UPI00141DEF3C|nr:hypothetical protein [Mangrovimonas sp. CR14]NIK92535.1 hypothetical protein [Mangrovimonas sp. CR14]